MSGIRYGAWTPNRTNQDPDAQAKPPKPEPREITVSALAILAGISSIAELRGAKGYLPTEVAWELNGIARGIREARRRSAG